MTTGKTIALTIQTFVGEVMSLLFNKLSRFVIAFLMRRQSAKELMLSNCSAGGDSWASLGQQGDQSSQYKGNQPWIFIGRADAETEAPTLWAPDTKSQLNGKDPDAGKNWRQNEKRVTEDETVGWHHQFNGHELGQTLGDGEGQGSLACYSPWGCKESDMTWWLNNNSNNYMMYLRYLRLKKISENSCHLFLSFDMMTRKY